MCKTLEDTSILCDLISSHKDSITSCISCKRVWIENLPVKENDFWELSLLSLSLSLLIKESDDSFVLKLCHAGLSHGACPVCLSTSKFADNIHKKQISEGNFPCFGTARRGFCDQINCKYRDLCVWPDPWSKGVLPETLEFQVALAEKFFRENISLNVVSENIERVAISLSPP